MHAHVLEVVNREATGQGQAAVVHAPGGQNVPVGLVVDLTHDLLEHILERHDPGRPAAFVDDHGELFALGLETAQRLRNRKAVRKIQDRSQGGLHPLIVAQQIPKVNDSDHLVQIPGANHRCA